MKTVGQSSFPPSYLPIDGIGPYGRVLITYSLAHYVFV